MHIKLFEEFVFENVLQKFADDLNDEARRKIAKVYKAYSDGKTAVSAASTTKTWDDGTPVLKYMARNNYDRKRERVTLPKEFEVVDVEGDRSSGWWYFKISGKWYGIFKDDVGTPPFEY